jgi:hypothetical protein
VTFFGAIAATMKAGSAPVPGFSFSGVLTTTSASTPVTSATRTVSGSGTALFESIGGITVSVQYSKNGGAFATITEGLTLALTGGDTLAVRSDIAVAPNTTTFNIKDNSGGALIEAVTLERT